MAHHAIADDVDRSIVAARPAPIGRIVRSLTVSAVTTGLSLTILAVLTATDALAPGPANVLATVAGIGPSLFLNRRWAWRRTGRSHWRRELLPFWTYALASLAVSTAAVTAVAGWVDGAGLHPSSRTIAVLAANVGSFAALWCGQFVLLDRLMTSRPAELG